MTKIRQQMLDSSINIYPLFGSSSSPSTPSSGNAQFYGIGTGHVRPAFMNDLGVARAILTALTAGDVQMQYGTIASTSIGANADADITVTLPTAWPNNHFAFFASGLPNTTWSGFYHAGASPNGSLTTGLAHWRNGGTAQNIINGWWVSLGN